MSAKRFLIFDIETIWDRALIAKVFGIAHDASLDVMRETILAKYNNGFLPPPYHRPVCIALIDVDPETSCVQNATVLENNDEKTLLQQFWKIVKFRKGNNPVKSTLVHFNGRGFDLPVLFYRSMKYRIPVVVQDDRSRYNFEFSHDICDDLCDFGASSRPSLDLLSKMLGLAGKTDINGSQVEELYALGERSRIRDYCMDDALATYHLWLTLRVVRGQLTEEKYREAFEKAAETIRNCRSVTDPFFGPEARNS